MPSDQRTADALWPLSIGALAPDASRFAVRPASPVCRSCLPPDFAGHPNVLTDTDLLDGLRLSISGRSPMTAEILYFNSDQYWDRQDEKRFALAERLGLDPDTELVSLPFPAIQDCPRPRRPGAQLPGRNPFRLSPRHGRFGALHSAGHEHRADRAAHGSERTAGARVFRRLRRRGRLTAQCQLAACGVDRHEHGGISLNAPLLFATAFDSSRARAGASLHNQWASSSTLRTAPNASNAAARSSNDKCAVQPGSQPVSLHAASRKSNVASAISASASQSLPTGPRAMRATMETRLTRGRSTIARGLCGERHETRKDKGYACVSQRSKGLSLSPSEFQGVRGSNAGNAPVDAAISS